MQDGPVTEAPIDEFWRVIILDLFGPSRTMIGSDWPVCTLSGDYTSVMNIVIDVVSTLSPEIRDAVLGQTCATWYNLLPL